MNKFSDKKIIGPIISLISFPLSNCKTVFLDPVEPAKLYFGVPKTLVNGVPKTLVNGKNKTRKGNKYYCIVWKKLPKKKLSKKTAI